MSISRCSAAQEDDMGGMSIWHWLVVGIVVMLLFGRGKISDMMGDVAKGIKAFKKGMAEEDNPASATAPAAPVDPLRSIEHQPAKAAESPATAAAGPLGERKVG
jgi:sec-independent protein translocase protein TatA